MKKVKCALTAGPALHSRPDNAARTLQAHAEGVRVELRTSVTTLLPHRGERPSLQRLGGSFSRRCLRACEPAPPHGVTSLSSVCASHVTQGRPSGDQPRPHVGHRGPCTGPLKGLQAGTFNPPRTWPCRRALPRHTPSLGTPPQRDAAGARPLSTRRDDPAVSTAHLTPSSGRLFVPRLPGDP